MTTSPESLPLLRKRLRQLARATFVLALGIVLAAAAFAIVWLTSLNGLPDIGDPFDVAEFRASRIPNDRNAFTYFRRANAMVTREPEVRSKGLARYRASWSKTDPKLRAWVEENRAAIEWFQRGSEQPDGIPDMAGDQGIARLSLLTLLEGSRRQESGDSAGAWDCYRSFLRSSALVVRREGFDAFRADLVNRLLQPRLATWAADPKTTTPQLRNALGEALATEPDPGWDAFELKRAYLEIMRLIERPVDPFLQQEIEGERTYRLGDMQLPADVLVVMESVRRFRLREPERSRRVVRLLWANWLAHAETRGPRSRKPAVRALLTAVTSVSLPIYAVDPGAPAGARALPPREVARWLVSTRDARLRLLWEWPSLAVWPPSRLYRRTHRAIVIMLATELYRRDRGTLPASEEALVGAYLERLPDDGSADLADETTSKVE